MEEQEKYVDYEQLETDLTEVLLSIVKGAKNG